MRIENARNGSPFYTMDYLYVAVEFRLLDQTLSQGIFAINNLQANDPLPPTRVDLSLSSTAGPSDTKYLVTPQAFMGQSHFIRLARGDGLFKLKSFANPDSEPDWQLTISDAGVVPALTQLRITIQPIYESSFPNLGPPDPSSLLNSFYPREAGSFWWDWIRFNSGAGGVGGFGGFEFPRGLNFRFPGLILPRCPGG
jgi:hypothetical protein